ncbi:MAG: hypothetical protein HY807_07885 [Nitrospirae bacterium]|nr:hypothetical protein [Nitrospirota bacterium]
MQLAGVYSGFENINGKSNARIIVLPDSEDCKERPVIELLLPMEKDSDSEVTFRLSDSINEQFLVKDKYSGQPVKIIFYSTTNDKKSNIDEGMKLMLSNYNWPGYPSTLIVGFKRNIYADTFAYKIASGDEDITMHHFNAEGKNHNKWACKNKENNVAGTMLKPFTVIFDIITFPIQALFAAIILGISGP